MNRMGNYLSKFHFETIIMSSKKKLRTNEHSTNDEVAVPGWRELSITDLPRDALSQIFQYFSYEDIAVKLRPVCREFCKVATYVLNSGLATLRSRIERAMNAAELGMRLSQNDNEKLLMSRCFNCLEVIRYQVKTTSRVDF